MSSQYCAWIYHRRVRGGELPIQISIMEQHLHQTSRHKNMILLKSCMVLLGHVSCLIFTELLAAGRGRTISFRCKCFGDKLVHRRCANRHSRIAVDGVISPMTPVLMDINELLRDNGLQRMNQSVSVETSLAQIHILF